MSKSKMKEKMADLSNRMKKEIKIVIIELLFSFLRFHHAVMNKRVRDVSLLG